MRPSFLILGLCVVAVAVAKADRGVSAVDLDIPGARTNGFVLLPNQWSLRPAGKHLIVGDFPVNIAVHPDGKYAAVLHSGNGPNEVLVFDISKPKIVSRAEIDESFYGLAFSGDGKTLLCSGAGS